MHFGNDYFRNIISSFVDKGQIEIINSQANEDISRQKVFLINTYLSDTGSFEAKWRLGVCLLKGIGTTRNSQMAKKLFQISMRKKVYESIFWFSQTFQEFERIVQILRPAVQLKHPLSMYYVGWIAFRLKTKQISQVEGIQLIHEAGRGNDKHVTEMVIELCFKGYSGFPKSRRQGRNYQRICQNSSESD
jgi:hypothetical protein